jgi:hypothetical protein
MESNGAFRERAARICEKEMFRSQAFVLILFLQLHGRPAIGGRISEKSISIL